MMVHVKQSVLKFQPNEYLRAGLDKHAYYKCMKRIWCREFWFVISLSSSTILWHEVTNIKIVTRSDASRYVLVAVFFLLEQLFSTETSTGEISRKLPICHIYIYLYIKKNIYLYMNISYIYIYIYLYIYIFMC